MDNDSFWPEFTYAIITFFIVIALFIFCAFLDKKYDDKLWNQGRCPECGSEWEYEQAVGHYYSTSYMYVCNKCGRRIEISDVR